MRMNGSVLTLLLVMLGSAGFAQSSVGALGRASDRAQQVFDGRTQESADTIHDGAAVEVQPQYPGSDTAMYRYLRNSIIYPKDEAEKKLSGKVYVQFVIGKDGKVDQVKVLRGVDPALDAEAVRAVRAMPSWIPARMNGKPVATRYVLPINFVAD
ncbi:MAG: energy transducer TonB [Flavobacteriales bacterium]